MSKQSVAYHSITFGSKNTWDDWHLIPTSRPFFELPDVRTNFVDIPGGYGSVDISEDISGHVLYENREGSFEFYVMHDYWNSWVDTVHDISSYIHGQRMKIILDDDPAYYYEGRVSVSWSSEEDYSKITFDVEAYPFKKELLDRSDDDWLWDPFDFEEGYIYAGDYNFSIAPSGTHKLVIEGTDEYIIPIINVSFSGSAERNSLSVKINGQAASYSLQSGNNILPELLIGEHNTLTLDFTAGSNVGMTQISVSYRGGEL